MGQTNSVLVDFWTEDGGVTLDESGDPFAEATSGEDYEAIRGTIAFTPGDSIRRHPGEKELLHPLRITLMDLDPEHHTRSVFIPILDDDVDEPIECFEIFFRQRTPNNVAETFKIGIFIFDDDNPCAGSSGQCEQWRCRGADNNSVSIAEWRIDFVLAYVQNN